MVKPVLIPFIVNKETSFIVEIGFKSIRFYAKHGKLVSDGEVYKTDSPYEYFDLFDDSGISLLQYVQNGDIPKLNNTPFIQDGIVIGLYGKYYYDFSVGGAGYLGVFNAYYLKVNGKNFAIGYKSSSTSNIYIMEWTGEYVDSAFDDSVNFWIGTHSLPNIQWLNVKDNKIYIGFSDITRIIDVSNFPTCTQEVITHPQTGGISICCTGDEDGDYDMKYISSTEISVMRKENGVWASATLPFFDRAIFQSPAYEANTKSLSFVDVDTFTLHVYQFNDKSKTFEEIILPEDVRDLSTYDDLATKFQTSGGYQYFRPLTWIGDNLHIAFVRLSESTAKRRYTYMIQTKPEKEVLNLVNNVSSNYYPEYSITGFATGNVDSEGKVEVEVVGV